jgi:hypothetical protein
MLLNLKLKSNMKGAYLERALLDCLLDLYDVWMNNDTSSQFALGPHDIRIYTKILQLFYYLKSNEGRKEIFLLISLDIDQVLQKH